MIFNVKFLTLASLFAVVLSQQPPQCVLDCSQAALSSATDKNCTSYADKCVCTDTGFQAADGACLQANCTASDQAAALQLQQTFCGAGNTTASGSSSAASTGSSAASSSKSMSGSMSGSMTSMSMTPSSSGESATDSSSAASPSTSSGAGPQAEFGFLTLGVAAAGAVVGGLLL